VMNFIADGRQWFKSEVGLGVRETPLDPSICAHAILQSELFVVQDTTKDARFADNPLVVGDPQLRFYAGALLRSREGHPLGTLCVLDTRPRELTDSQLSALQVLAEHVRNMLELRRSNEELREIADSLGVALAARQRLVATVAHDLRTPLNVITLAARMLQDPETSPQVARVVAGRLGRASSSMTRLVEDLLDLEAHAGGGLSIEPRPMALAPLLRDVVELMTPLADQASVNLVLEVSRDGEVAGDYARLHQVVTNLVGNALKFTPTGGEVRVRMEVEGSVVSVCVTDTGVGIALEDREAIFDPFVRVRSMNTRGAGLGLAIARRVLEAHRGSIGVESEVGAGSSFCFTLPTLSS